MSKKRVKAGTSKAAAKARKVRFASAYIINGRNGSEAAITAGFSPKGAGVAASRLLKDPKVVALIAEATEKAAGKAGLSVERTLLEVSRLAYSDPRRLYDKDGQMIPVHLLDDDTAATVASIKIVEKAGSMKIGGAEGLAHIPEQTKEVKVWDKNAALEKAMKYHGLYKEDNRQIGESLALRVVFGK